MVGEEHSDKSMLWVHGICGLSELRVRRKPTTCEDYLKHFCGFSELRVWIFWTDPLDSTSCRGLVIVLTSPRCCNAERSL